jgi:large subunit ribosomal protein L31e
MARQKTKKTEEKKGVPKDAPVTRVATINLHKRLHGVTFKKRAPRAVREIKKFAASLMSTKDVRIDTDLNKFIWSKGVRNVPFRVRVTLSRQRGEEEDDAEKRMYTLVELKDVPSFKGLQTQVVADKAE